MAGSTLYIPLPNAGDHLFIILKSAIVLSSWICAYYGLKHLPITIASPINASRPILVLVGAIFVFGERLNLWQWLGVLLSIGAFGMLSVSGRKEGINFRHDRWIWLVVLGTVLGAISGLYDKYLMQYRCMDKMTVQSWYNFYQVLMMGVVFALIWWPNRRRTTPFQWRWSIPLISIFLSVADFCYFYALSDPDALISVVSLIRRSGVIVGFVSGWLFFKERNILSKSVDLLLVILAMFLLWIGTTTKAHAATLTPASALSAALMQPADVDSVAVADTAYNSCWERYQLPTVTPGDSLLMVMHTVAGPAEDTSISIFDTSANHLPLSELLPIPTWADFVRDDASADQRDLVRRLLFPVTIRYTYDAATGLLTARLTSERCLPTELWGQLRPALRPDVLRYRWRAGHFERE
jgi:drug/metabolite transporter (DMT)-like permease